MEEAAVSFAEPAWLWASVAIPLLLALFFASERRRVELMARVIAERLMPRLAGNVSVAKRRLRFALAMLGLACAIVALARPQWGFTWEQTKRKGRDVIIAIDTSRSMLADDIKPDRLTRAKLAAQDLIEELSGDRVGVIAFAGTAFLQAPLTIDYTAALGALKELDTDIIPQGGTNLEGALLSAREAFGKGESDNRALVIFSDGEELDANAEKAADEIKKEVRIFAVGIGTPEGALIPVRTRGRLEFVKDDAGNPVRSRLDETRLRAIAEAAGGFYVPLQTGRPEMQRIVRDGFGKMNERDIDARLSRRPIERYQWPLAGAIAFLGVSMMIGERRRRAAVISLLLLAPTMAQARNDGVEAYERKDYDAAHEEFARQLKRRPNLPALEFDLGGAAYKRGDYDGALESFGRAMTTEDPGLRAKAAYNLGNTLFQRGAAQQEKEAKLSEWKNALQHYDESLGVDPKNADTIYNRDVLRKLIADLEKEPPKQDEQEQKKDDQKKDDQKKDEQKDQKQDKGDQQQKDQESGKQEQQPQKPEQDQGKPGEQKDAKSGDQPPQDQPGEQKQDGKPEQKEGEQPPPKKEGDLQGAPQDGESQEQRDAAEARENAQAAAEGRMTPQQARALLESLKGEDEKVRLVDPRERSGMKRVLKDW
ncbi:MAG: VWA domain-containing protein [Chthoniobacteraceae bacterium]